MKHIKIIAFIGVALCVFQNKAKATNADTIYAAALKPIGRTVLNNQHQLELITSAAHFGVSFKGKTCAIYVTTANAPDHSYLQYTLDGVYQKKLRVEGNAKNPLIIKMDNGRTHRIWIYKATEATTGALIFSKIVANDIKSINIPKLPFIEFIGNSITCGAYSDTSVMPCGKGEYQDYHNAYMAYGPRVSRMLNVNFVLTSVSGIGMYRTWNTETNSMPKVYQSIDLQGSSQQWNFKSYTPKIVSIALGTNDMSLGDGRPRAAFDSNRFVSTYVKFVQLVKTKYPKARIALLSSPMLQNNDRETLQKCLIRIKNEVDSIYPSDKPVATFFFEPMVTHGCAFHPSVSDHQVLAEELKPFFARLLAE